MPFWKSDKHKAPEPSEEERQDDLRRQYASVTSTAQSGPSASPHHTSDSKQDSKQDSKHYIKLPNNGPPPPFPGTYSSAPPGPNNASTFDAPPPTLFRTQFASISMHMWDRLRVLDFPPPVIDTVRHAIREGWDLGIQDERVYGGAFEFKFRGNPWRGAYDDGIAARRVVRCIYAALFEQGWLLAFSTDISKKQMDSDMLVFRYQAPPPPPHEWICVAFSRSDRLRLLDAPPEFCEQVARELGPAVQSREPHRMPGVFELKLLGYPWYAASEETMAARRLILLLVGILENHGFTIYSSVDQKSGSSGDNGGRETDTWHCCRRIGWQPGEPVFHG